MSGGDEMRASADAAIVASLRAWAIDVALPLWARAGYDAERGGFQERLHLDGTPDLAAPRRALVQARQIYVYAHAAVLGWYPEGRDLALEAFTFLIDNYRAPDGAPGYVHSLSPDGDVLDPRRDTYDHAFIVLAFAWLARATGDAQIDRLIGDALSFMDDHLAARDGTLYEGRPATTPRRQNPHMHAYEAMLALHETIAYPGALARAGKLRVLLEEKFMDAQTRTIGEYFTDAWVPVPGAGDIVEPGHHAEWSWLLQRHHALGGPDSRALAAHLLDVAHAAIDPSSGFVVDGTDRSGRVQVASRRCWPQTEYVKAMMAAAEAGRPNAAHNGCAMLQRVAAHYLAAPFAGGWIDKFDAQGQSLMSFVPGSTLYHLFGAIAEADRVVSGGHPQGR